MADLTPSIIWHPPGWFDIWHPPGWFDSWFDTHLADLTPTIINTCQSRKPSAVLIEDCNLNCQLISIPMCRVIANWGGHLDFELFWQPQTSFELSSLFPDKLKTFQVNQPTVNQPNCKGVNHSNCESEMTISVPRCATLMQCMKDQWLSLFSAQELTAFDCHVVFPDWLTPINTWDAQKHSASQTGELQFWIGIELPSKACSGLKPFNILFYLFGLEWRLVLTFLWPIQGHQI
jgi:hypothetical protein